MNKEYEKGQEYYTKCTTLFITLTCHLIVSASSVSASQRVSVSACQRLSMSACQHLSVSACQRVSVSASQRFILGKR